MATFLKTRTVARPSYLTMTQTLAAALMPPMLVVFIIPIIGPMLFFVIVAPIWIAKLQSEFVSETANHAADMALDATLSAQTMLSKKTFTE